VAVEQMILLLAPQAVGPTEWLVACRFTAQLQVP
jgi:hypothetical protein